MKKYKITTAKNAVKKGLLKVGDEVWVKVGDEVWVKVKVNEFYLGGFFNELGQFFDPHKIRIPIPEPKPIDFGSAGRVLKSDNGDVVKTTGYKTNTFFSAYVIETSRHKKGLCFNDWIISDNWTDITDTYEK